MVLPKIEQYDTDEITFWHFLVKEMPNCQELSEAKAKHFQMLNEIGPMVP